MSYGVITTFLNLRCVQMHSLVLTLLCLMAHETDTITGGLGTGAVTITSSHMDWVGVNHVNDVSLLLRHSTAIQNRKTHGTQQFLLQINVKLSLYLSCGWSFLHCLHSSIICGLVDLSPSSSYNVLSIRFHSWARTFDASAVFRRRTDPALLSLSSLRKSGVPEIQIITFKNKQPNCNIWLRIASDWIVIEWIYLYKVFKYLCMN